MEELLKISKEYYVNCVDLRLFGLKGSVFVVIGIPFIAFSMFVAIKFNTMKPGLDVFIIIPQCIGMLFWYRAKKVYDENLVCRLKAYTNLESKVVNEHKILYLSSLTTHIGNSLFEVVKNMTEIMSLHNKSRAYTVDNIGYHFSKFLYDPESKNRILSLSIYLISLVAILTVIKPATNVEIFTLFQSITFEGVVSYFGLAAIFIILIYFVFMVPISFAIGYVISPILRKTSNNSFLLGYFISELCKFAFSEKPLEKKSGKGELKSKSIRLQRLVKRK